MKDDQQIVLMPHEKFIQAVKYGVAQAVDNWVKGFMGIGLTFCIGSSFTLAKTIRDNQEFKELSARRDEA